MLAEAQRTGMAAGERMRDLEPLGRATLVPSDDLVRRDTHAESLRWQILSEVHVVDDDPPPAARQDVGGRKGVTGAARRAHPGLHFRCTLGSGGRVVCTVGFGSRTLCTVGFGGRILCAVGFGR